jgi:hypothetical protein
MTMKHLTLHATIVLVAGNLIFYPQSVRASLYFMNLGSRIPIHGAFTLLLLLGIALLARFLSPNARWWQRLAWSTPIAVIACVGGVLVAAGPLLSQAGFPASGIASIMRSALQVTVLSAAILALLLACMVRRAA